MKIISKFNSAIRVLCVFAFSLLLLPFQSCDEELADILDKIQVFAFDYRIVPSDVYSTESAIALIEDQNSNFINGMERFTPQDTVAGFADGKYSRMNGDPSQSGSSFQIIMKRESSSDLHYVRSIQIVSPQGPFHEGQTLSNATIEISTGMVSNGKTFNSAQADIDVKVKITTVNTISKKFGGEFYFVLRDINQPAVSDFICGANGSFLFNY